MSARNICFLGVLLLFAMTSAFGQMSTGSIAGTVKDTSGAVIPGVSVTLSSPGVIGGNQQIITTERGTFQFTRLVPGKYSVKAELSGFRPAALENLTVNADVTVRADLALEVGNVSDTVTVTGEAPLLDTTSALNQSVLDRATMDKLPTGHDLWSIGKTVPGVNVTTYDVGGNQSFQQYSPTVHGSAGTDNKYAIDGLDVAWAGGAGTVMVYFDPNMFEEVNYQVGNISAENRQGGVVMNMVTKTGTNAFHGSFMFTGTNQSLQADNLQNAALKAQLTKQIPAVVLAANPNIRPGQEIQSLFDTAASLSGPFVKDKFWFTSTYKVSSLNQFVLGSYNPNGTQGVDDNRIINGTGKLSYQISNKSQLHYTYSRNLKYRYHRRTADFQEDAASRFQDQWADIHQLKWTGALSTRIVTDAGVSLQVGPSPYLPKPEAIVAGTQGLFPKTDQATGASTVMNTNYSAQPQYRLSSNYNLSYFAGAHDIKVGYQLNRIMSHTRTWSLVDPTKAPLPGPFSARYNTAADGTVTGNQVTLYNYPSDPKSFLQEHGFFLQDKWTVTRKFTLNLGFRYDRLNGWVPAQCQPDTAFVPGQCFNAIGSEQIPTLNSFAPRFSFIYDVMGDGKMAIKGSANVYHTGLASGYPSLVNPYGTASNAVNWSDANKDQKPQPEEIAYNFVTRTTSNGTGWDFNSNNFYDKNLKRPYSVEYNIGVQREFPGGVVVAATYVHRDNWRTMGAENIALNESHYDPIEVTLPPNPEVGYAGQTMTIYNIKSQFQTLGTCTGFGAKCQLTSNHSDRGEWFNGVDLTVNKRMSSRWMMNGGLSFGSNQARVGYRKDNPNLNLFQGGPTGGNIPMSAKISGIYQAPLGFEVATSFQRFSGTPELPTYTIQRNTSCSAIQLCVASLTPTSLTVNVAQRGNTDKPDVQLLDLSIGREFRISEKGLRISPKMEFFNLMNADTVTTRSVNVSGTAGNTYLNPRELLSPRMVRLGLQLNF
jgi:hypothetical protein